MTNEEMERAMDFILKSQARAEARIGQAEERQARTDEQPRAVRRHFERLVEAGEIAIAAGRDDDIGRNISGSRCRFRLIRERGGKRLRDRFDTLLLARIELGLLDDTQRERPRVDRPPGRSLLHRDIVLEALCEPPEQRGARRTFARREEIRGHPFFQRADEHGYFAPERAAIIAQQTLTAARIVSHLTAVPGDDLKEFLAWHIIHQFASTTGSNPSPATVSVSRLDSGR